MSFLHINIFQDLNPRNYHINRFRGTHYHMDPKWLKYTLFLVRKQSNFKKWQMDILKLLNRVPDTDLHVCFELLFVMWASEYTYIVLKFNVSRKSFPLPQDSRNSQSFLSWCAVPTHLTSDSNTCSWGSSHCGPAKANPTSTREDAGSTPGLSQWVKEGALLWAEA